LYNLSIKKINFFKSNFMWMKSLYSVELQNNTRQGRLLAFLCRFQREVAEYQCKDRG
jgi:hypothetical protein